MATKIITRIMALAIVMSMLMACGGYARPPEPQRPASTVYGVVSNPKTGELQELNLEIRLPDPSDPQVGPGPYPVLLFIHGGFWVQGNWDDFEGAIDLAAAKGYVAVSINYRLLATEAVFPYPIPPASRQLNEWPAAMQDANCAARWINAHVADYNIQTQLNGQNQQEAVIGAVGHSAGAASALLLALAEDHIPFQSDCQFDGLEDTSIFSRHISSVAALSPPTDLTSLLENLIFEKILLAEIFAGGLPSEVGTERFDEASAINYILDNTQAPIMLMHGALDEIIDVETTDDFASAISLQSRRSVYIRYPDNNHDWLLGGNEAQHTYLDWEGAAGTQGLTENYIDSYFKMLGFMDETLRGAPPIPQTCVPAERCVVVQDITP